MMNYKKQKTQASTYFNRGCFVTLTEDKVIHDVLSN